MANGIYVGIDGTPHKVKDLYAGIDNIPHKVKKVYVGVDGVPKLVWQSSIYTGTLSTGATFSTVSTYKGYPNYAKIIQVNSTTYFQVYTTIYPNYANIYAWARVITYVNNTVTFGTPFQIDYIGYSVSDTYPPNSNLAYQLRNHSPEANFSLQLKSNGNVVLVVSTDGYVDSGNDKATIYYREFSISGTTITSVCTPSAVDTTIFGFGEVTYNESTNQVIALTNGNTGMYGGWYTKARFYTVNSGYLSLSAEVTLWQSYYWSGSAGYNYYAAMGFNKLGNRLIVVRSSVANAQVYDTLELYSITNSAITRISTKSISVYPQSLSIISKLITASLSNSVLLLNTSVGSYGGTKALKAISYTGDVINISSADTAISNGSSYMKSLSICVNKTYDEDLYFCPSSSSDPSYAEPFVVINNTTVEVVSVYGYATGSSGDSSEAAQMGDDIIWFGSSTNTSTYTATEIAVRTYFS
jgi:hypothetical protein